MKEDILWVCYLKKKGFTPAIAESKLGSCKDCNSQIWYDPNLLKIHPILSKAIKVCIECGSFRALTTKDEVKIRYPHREN